MLRLCDIVKNYPTATTVVQALRGVNLSFRQNEFVAILGPSGCGKTTMLNIIGGLDRYTSGDLVIGGVSTANFDEEHWDAYRNATIGFVFQSYNLIPHLNVLENVELALSLSGENKKTRRAKAVAALHKVGMSEQINQRPNQLSGGQMQRVAIARAIVNNPKIILADEPTGALDSELSVQVMDILQELAQDRLVIMVTHNNELAQAYCTRICRFKDGQLVEDTNPYQPSAEHQDEQATPQEEASSTLPTSTQPTSAEVDVDALFADEQNPRIKQRKIANYKRKAKMKQLSADTKKTFERLGLNTKKKRKFHRNKGFKPTSMRLGTAFGLSLKNLISKRRRTFFTAFAGSIGIIGLALVLSISNGFDVFVENMQTQMLSNVPLGIYEYNVEINVLNSIMMDMSGQMGSSSKPQEPMDDKFTVTQTGSSGAFDQMVGQMMSSFFKSVTSNDLTEGFADYMRKLDKSKYGAMSTYYGTRFNLISYDDDTETYKDVSQSPSPTNAMQIATTVLGSQGLQPKYWHMLVGDEQFMLSQYDIIGKYPQNKNEIVLCVNKQNQIDQELLNAFGINIEQKDTYTSADFIGKTLRLIDNDGYYKKSEFADERWFAKPDEYDLTKQQWGYNNQDTLKNMYNSSEETLTVVGIIREKQDSSAGYVGNALCYTPELAQYVLEKAIASQVAAFQRQLVQEAKDENEEEIQNIFGDVVPKDQVIGTDGDATQGDSVDLFSLLYSLSTTSYLKAIGAKRAPTYIAVYPNNFSQKTAISNYINAYTGGKIGYFDVSEMFVFYLNMMIDLVSVILIAVASISLVVSTVMIGVITSNSVIERTREIGILRSLGARKTDIRRVFLAETALIGLFSGLLGILVTYVLCPLINLIIASIVPMAQNLLHFHPLHAIVLVVLSFTLTIISGLVPAISASRKNVVEALRVE